MKAFLSLFLGLSLSGAALATVPVTSRSDWVSEDGTDLYHADQGGGGTWTETVNGAATYHFRELERTNDYVKLYDDSRGVYIFLYATNSWINQGAAGTQFLRNGHWDDRRLFSYRLSDGIHYFNLYPGKVWRYARPSGGVTYVNEVRRTNDYIQVYDPVTHHTFSLFDGEVWAQPDGGTLYKLADGSWG